MEEITMKATRLIGAAVAAVCLGSAVASAPAFAADKSASVSVQLEPKVWVNYRAKAWDTEHKTWVQRGGYVGYRFPDDKAAMYFGPERTFRLSTLPYQQVSNEPRFQYNGYWMTVVDPWPESWPESWYSTDDVYIRYDNGYYLYNTKYPDVGLSLRFNK
jgi:hypothetical protein